MIRAHPPRWQRCSSRAARPGWPGEGMTVPARFGFHIGPFYFSQRLGRTQAQKRASAKARQDRRQQAAAREAAAAEQARHQQAQAAWEADYTSRIGRYRVADCHIDTLKGGSFTLEAENGDQIGVEVTPAAAVHFLPLRNGDTIKLTRGPGGTGVAGFRHVSRADSSYPDTPIQLDADDMERLGLSGHTPD
jgi:hypothetical protein